MVTTTPAVTRFENIDCLTKMDTEQYDYVYLSSPDFEDADNVAKALGSPGVDISRPSTYSTQYLDLLIPRLHPRLGTITVAFTADRRNNSRILPKNYYLMATMFGLGYYLRAAKYALKSTSVNLYSSNVIHILTFQHEGKEGKFNLRKDKLYDSFGPDVWGPFRKEHVIDGEVVGQPIEIAERCVANFTDAGDVVYDPFAGIGTTLVAARGLQRGYIGAEIREVIWSYGKKAYKL